MATTYDKASLVMIPSGVKEDKLYSIKPTSGDGDFTFSRGSDIEATRVNSSGNIEKAKVNTLLYSNDFDTGFSKTRASLVSGQSGYDGTNDAWAFVDDTNNSTHLIVQTISSTSVATFSVYAKAGAVDFLAMRYEDASVEYAYFDLSSGTLGTINSGYIDAKITNVGGGWYRCEATRTSANKVVILSAETDNDPTYAGTGTTAIYIQDAQLNYGLVAQDYVETTTTAVVEGLTADLPRLDYSGGASCPSLLLEPSRTNIIDQSEYFGAWSFGSGITLTHNYATSPEGVQNATLLARTTSGNVQQSKSVTSGETYAISVFGHAGTSSIVQISATGTLNTSVTQFDLSDQSITTTTGSVVDADIENYGNGWYRCWLTQTAASTGSGLVRINTGDNVNILLYGAQLEAGSYPTSYIPTYGTAAGRGEDDCAKTGISSLISASEYTIFWEGSHIPTGEYNSFATIYNSSATNQSARFYRNNTDNQIYAAAFISGSSVTLASGVTDESVKCAFRVKSGDFALYVNGSLVASSTSTMTPSASLDSVNMQYLNSSQSFDQNAKQMVFFKQALTNAELATLTTI